MSDPLAIGADGIRGGWVAVVVRGTDNDDAMPAPDQRRVQLRRFDSVAELAAWRGTDAPGAALGLDVPLGLLEHGGSRPCDIEARTVLGYSK